MKLINKIREKVSIQRFAFICIFSLMFTFNGFLFNQIDVMFNNQADFGISPQEVMYFFVLVAFAVFLLLTVILTCISYFSNKAFVYTTATLMGIVIAGYVQVLFMNKTELMGVAGTMARETIPQFILNFLIYGSLIALPILAVYFERKKGKVFTPKLALLLSIVIFGMQFVGVISSANAVTPPAKDNELYYFSVEEQLKLSKNENVVVFVLDRLDCEYVDALFEENPDAEEIFSGFTYYKNNISKYPGTFPSVTSLLTDHDFDKNVKDQKKYLQDAWTNPKLLEVLKDNNYTVNALLDSTSTFYGFGDLEGKIDNIKPIKRENRKVKNLDFYFAVESLVLMRQSMDASKALFQNERYLDVANYCVDIKNTPEYFPRTISGNSDLLFFDKLTENGGSLTADKEENVFSFVHLQASHAPYVYDRNLNKNKDNALSSKLDTLLGNDEKAIEQTYGTTKILKEYFDQMKKLGIYDNSTIILLGDHGIWENFEKDNPPTTALFIKESQKNKEPSSGEPLEKTTGLKRDATSELSHESFSATILEIIGAENEKDDKKSYYDIIKSGGKDTRLFYNIRWTNLNSCTYLNTYEIKDNAKDPNNWTIID